MPTLPHRSLAFIVAMALVVSGCGGSDDGPVVAPSAAPADYTYNYSGSGYGIDHLDTPASDSGETTFTYTVNLGNAVKTLFFVFTNVSGNDTAAPPQATSAAVAAAEMAAARQRAADTARKAAAAGLAVKGRADVSLFNSNPRLYAAATAPAVSSAPAALFTVSSAPRADTVGASTTFYTSASTTDGVINATCRKTATDGTVTLSIYVDDNAWGTGCGEPECVTQTMVDALAGRFLASGDDNDIHDWVAAIYGNAWGAHAYADLIPASAAGDITILLYDIDNDNSVNGGTVGYFWSKDNLLQTSCDYSNERLMFYLDSNLFAVADGSSWDPSDYWPQTTFGTLAHEFQHMIFFYQKQVKNGLARTTRWLNEMASEMAEDFIARKAGIDGPRGVAYNDGSAGASGNVYGLLPRFNRFDYIPLTVWQTGPVSDPGDGNELNSYAIVYAFGAYLARNFGGAPLFRDMVQNDRDGPDAVSAALAGQGYADDFAAVLRKWGAAVLLSDDPTPAVPQGYRYNVGDFFSSTVNTKTYAIGSIDLTNYLFIDSSPDQVGPKYYTALPSAEDPAAGTYRTSNLYYLVGTGLTGTVTRKITLPAGVKLTAVIR